MGHKPGEVPLRIDGDVDEQRAEDEQVRAVIDGVFNEGRFNLSRDGETT